MFGSDLRIANVSWFIHIIHHYSLRSVKTCYKSALAFTEHLFLMLEVPTLR